MNKKRVFLSVNPPAALIREIENQVEKIKPLFDPKVRFVDPESWHLTLIFLGDQSDDELNRINEAAAEVAADFPPVEILFDKIVYGPVGRTPRMVWLTATAETSAALGKLKAALEERLAAENIRFEQEHRRFTAHLTLARFTADIREGLPALELPFKGRFEAAGFHLTQSHLGRGASRYESLAGFDFEGDPE